mmetsp:Transcript_132518/g.342887  ORF Transcript_132518/g.342887 Transcript_132518/m.342887 type:complete len:200 (-) Transcript_132518:307-906(-)
MLHLAGALTLRPSQRFVESEAFLVLGAQHGSHHVAGLVHHRVHLCCPHGVCRVQAAGLPCQLADVADDRRCLHQRRLLAVGGLHHQRRDLAERQLAARFHLRDLLARAAAVLEVETGVAHRQPKWITLASDVKVDELQLRLSCRPLCGAALLLVSPGGGGALHGRGHGSGRVGGVFTARPGPRTRRGRRAARGSARRRR